MTLCLCDPDPYRGVIFPIRLISPLSQKILSQSTVEQFKSYCNVNVHCLCGYFECSGFYAVNMMLCYNIINFYNVPI